MLVGIEATSVVVGQRSGVGQFTDYLLRAMTRQAKTTGQAEFVYYANKYAPVVDESGLSVQAHQIYPKHQLNPRLLWMQTRLPRSIAKTKPDLCHFPNYLVPLSRVTSPYVVTMYDMSVYSHPEYHPAKTVLVHKAIIPKAAARAKAIITISESARQDILHYLDVPPEKVRVIYGGVSEQFQPERDFAAEEQIRQAYSLDFPFVLTVGTLEPRKNHARLIQAFAQLVKQERIPQHLVLVGGNGWKNSPLWESVQQSGIADRLHFLGYVPRQALPNLYRMAEGFAFPSFQEGFGLPVLEAMACGTPVLTSNSAALIELTNGAALTVNPLSVDELASGLDTILNRTDQAGSLRQAGVKRAAFFDWDKTAAQTLQLYQEVYDLQQATPAIKPKVLHFSADAESPATQHLSPVTYHPSPITRHLSPVTPLPLNLAEAILQTILYADIFTFPLTLAELQRYLVKYKATEAEIQQAIQHSPELGQQLEQRSGYIFLKGRHETVDRRERQAPAVKQGLKAARFWGKWLQAVPYLETALLTGSLAMHSARHRDDIDLLLLTKPGRLWTCRALVIGLVRLARLQGVELCPNYLLATTDYALSLTEHNLYTAHELAHAQLLFGEVGYQHLRGLNQWLTDFLPNADQPNPALLTARPGPLARFVRKLGEKLLDGKIGDRLERWEQTRKIAKLSQPNELSEEVQFSAEVCKGHFGGYSNHTLAAFAERYQSYLAENRNFSTSNQY